MIESKSLEQLHNLYELANYNASVNGSDYVFLHVRPGDTSYTDALKEALRFTGMIIVMVKSGSVKFSINIDTINLTANSLMISGPHSLLTVDTDSIRDLDAYLLFVNDKFFQDLNFEVIVLNNIPLSSKHSPVISLPTLGTKQVMTYMELLDMNARLNNGDGDTPFSKSISRSLLTSLFYQIFILSSHNSRTDFSIDDPDSPQNEIPRNSSRRMLYFREFIRMVRKQFRYEHTVRFYANKLCISPKYLSLIVRETSGKTAAQIIDDFLLLEAKNLLRFSGKNIQQIAFELNFSNQSSFGKFFKNLTGMSPTEFQNS